MIQFCGNASWNRARHPQADAFGDEPLTVNPKDLYGTRNIDVRSL